MSERPPVRIGGFHIEAASPEFAYHLLSLMLGDNVLDIKEEGEDTQ